MSETTQGGEARTGNWFEVSPPDVDGFGWSVNAWVGNIYHVIATEDTEAEAQAVVDAFFPPGTDELRDSNRDLHARLEQVRAELQQSEESLGINV